MDHTDTTTAPTAPADALTGATESHKQLQAFVGAWRLEGRQLETDVGPASDITGVERYEWLSGGFFMIHHFHAHVGTARAACIEMLSYDGERDLYLIRTFYDDGRTNEWTLRDGGGVWVLNGDWVIGGELRRVRCAIVFIDPRVRTCLWEYSIDGAWRTFWEVRAMALA